MSHSVERLAQHISNYANVHIKHNTHKHTSSMLDDVKWYGRLPLFAFKTCHQVDQCTFVLVALQYIFFVQRIGNG